MNKIVIDREEFCLDDFKGKLEYQVDKLKLNIKGHVILNDFVGKDNLNLEITLDDDAILEYNYFSFITKKLNVVVNQNNNSKLDFKSAFVANYDTMIKIKNNILGNNNVSNILSRVTSKSISKVIVDATLNVLDGTFNNEVKEDLKGLEQNNSSIKIIPNMLVASSEVIANHNVAIGNVDCDSLFYLTSKGISEDNAKKLLEKGFLISIFDKDVIEELKEFFE